jgi:transposase
MAKPYSVDLRERVVAGTTAGGYIRAVGEQFSVSPASVSRWSQQWRETGNVEAKKRGRRESPLAGERTWLLERIAEESDIPLRQLQAELAERGTVVCYGTVWNFVHGEKLSFKKKRHA